MKKRNFGKAGLEATELALGTWAFGGRSYGDVSEADSIRAIQAYIDGGGNFIDTARSYLASEERIGKALKQSGQRDGIIIASKTPHGDETESLPKMRADLEESLRLLQTDRIDVYQLHRPPEDRDAMEAAIAEMETFKQEGKIRAIGASIKGPQVTQATVDLCRQYIDTGKIDAIQLIYSIFRQKNSDIFDYAAEHGVGLIARTVLESGFLPGKYDGAANKPAGNHRSRWTDDQLAAFKQACDQIHEYCVMPPYDNVAQVAIKFALVPSAVTTLILGATSPSQVERNLATEELPALPQDAVRWLTEHFASFNDLSNP